MVEINIEDLRSFRSIKEDKARQIINETTKVVLNWETPIGVTPASERITVDVPDHLREHPLIIVLMNKAMKAMAALGYDQKEKKFRLAEINSVHFVDNDSHLFEAEQMQQIAVAQLQQDVDGEGKKNRAK
jgi:hypothetical protein